MQDLEMILRLHTEQVGKCSTCENHIPSDMPGVVTDYGKYIVESPIFASKVCGLKEEICPLYIEESVEPIRREIERIKQRCAPEREEDTNG